MFERLRAAADDLRAETSPELAFDVQGREPFSGMIGIVNNPGAAALTDDEQLVWLTAMGNRMVNALRLRLALAM